MMIVDLLQYLVIFCFALPFFIFGTYGLILVYFRNKGRRSTNGCVETVFEPKVSVVTPTHNESSIISKKIENLLATNYPKDKIELVFIDDSNDSTPEIIQKYVEKYSNVRLISFRERMGYSPCMFEGVKASTGEIIVLSDAGSFHDNETIGNLVNHFRDPNIGAVTGKDVILNVDEAVGSSEALYLRFLDFVKTSETNMDSTFYFKGEASAARKSLISDFEGCTATFDTAIALFIRQKGYKTIFVPEAKFYEYAPKNRDERIKQKTIRAANWIKILFQFKDMAFRYKYNKFGLFTMPASFGMLVLVPISILVGLISLIALTFFNPIPSLFIWGFIGLASFLSFVLSRDLLPTFVDLEVSLLKALYEIVFTKKKHDQIDTVQSTRR